MEQVTVTRDLGIFGELESGYEYRIVMDGLTEEFAIVDVGHLCAYPLAPEGE